MEYYEQDFIDFENYSIMVGKTMKSTLDNPYANANFILENFAKYEKFWKRESRKEYQCFKAAQSKKMHKDCVRKASGSKNRNFRTIRKTVKVPKNLHLCL